MLPHKRAHHRRNLFVDRFSALYYVLFAHFYYVIFFFFFLDAVNNNLMTGYSRIRRLFKTIVNMWLLQLATEQNEYVAYYTMYVYYWCMCVYVIKWFFILIMKCTRYAILYINWYVGYTHIYKIVMVSQIKERKNEAK